MDAAGNLYGDTHSGGGTPGGDKGGTVFTLAPPEAGETTWTETILQYWNDQSSSGPTGPLTMWNGTLYGVFDGYEGPGEMFTLTPSGANWTYKEIWDAQPYGDLGNSVTVGPFGNLYYTTWVGYGPARKRVPGTPTVGLYRLAPDQNIKSPKPILVSSGPVITPILLLDTKTIYAYVEGSDTGSSCSTGCGSVVQIVPSGPRQWTTNTIWNFTGGADGGLPLGSLIKGKHGVLFGSTSVGGASGLGTVFSLTPPEAGQTAWTETTLWSFSGTDGSNPSNTLLRDSTGALYGSAVSGGSAGCGLVFRLAPPPAGQTTWTESTLYTFLGNSAKDGCNPVGQLVADAAGTLYGDTAQGGKPQNYGVVYSLTGTGFAAYTNPH